jgi:hypothetical protein
MKDFQGTLAQHPREFFHVLLSPDASLFRKRCHWRATHGIDNAILVSVRR